MAIPHAKPGEVVDMRPLGPALSAASTWTIVKTDALEVIRIVLPAGKELPPHQVPGQITVMCLEGKVDFRVGESNRELTAGSFLHLEGGSEHSLRASENSSLLVTILLQHRFLAEPGCKRLSSCFRNLANPRNIWKMRGSRR